MKIKANFKYNDLELNRTVKENEIIEVTDERGKELTTKKYNGIPFGTLVEESKAEEPKPKRERAVRKPKTEKAVK